MPKASGGQEAGGPPAGKAADSDIFKGTPSEQAAKASPKHALSSELQEYCIPQDQWVLENVLSPQLANG